MAEISDATQRLQVSFPSLIVVMGVGGSGKTTIGTMLPEHLQWRFADGDQCHSAANVSKMNSGVALNDADRIPWLQSIAEWMDDCRRTGVCAVVTCLLLAPPALRDEVLMIAPTYLE